MSTPTYNWRGRRTEHNLYAEIVPDITTRNLERKDTYRKTEKKQKEIGKVNPGQSTTLDCH